MLTDEQIRDMWSCASAQDQGPETTQQHAFARTVEREAYRHAAEIERLRVERDTLKADSEMLVMYGKKIKALRADLDCLLMLVAKTYPGESRYDTAARYIREAERLEVNPAQEAKEQK